MTTTTWLGHDLTIFARVCGGDVRQRFADFAIERGGEMDNGERERLRLKNDVHRLKIQFIYARVFCLLDARVGLICYETIEWTVDVRKLL